MRATRPLFWFCGGTPPTLPARGLAPPGPPVFPPSLALGSPVFWAPLVAGLLMRATRPLFWFCGGTPPTSPWPPLPTPVGSGFASVLGPTRSGFANAGCSPPFGFVGGTPHAPAMGALPPGPPLPALVGLGFASVSGPTRGGLTSPPAPLRGGEGRTSPSPEFPPSLAGKGARGLGRKGTPIAMGASPPWTPIPPQWGWGGQIFRFMLNFSRKEVAS